MRRRATSVETKQSPVVTFPSLTVCPAQTSYSGSAMGDVVTLENLLSEPPPLNVSDAVLSVSYGR